jgi:hypothetical protein
MTARGWVIGALVALLIVGLVAFARGRVNHRGPQEVGTKTVGTTTLVVRTPAA